MIDRERLTIREVVNELTCCEDHKPIVKKIDNNTFEITYPGDRRAIRYHHTDIITYLPNGDIVLNTDGWKTSTTKDRMGYLGNDGYHISQQDKVWYLVKRSNGQRWTYQDGMTIHPDGTIDGQGEDPKELLKLDKSILKYVDGYIRALLARKIPKPGPGDCWECCIVTQDGKTLGEHTHGSHLRSHIEEKYYVPSLLTRAIEIFPVSIVANNEIGYLLGYHDQTMGDTGKSIIKSQVRSSLKRYMRRQLGLAA